MRSLVFLLAALAALLLPTSSAFADPGWTWPVRGPVLTHFVNGDDPYAAGQHRGIDIGAGVGTPIVAAASGTVVYAGVVGSSGLTVAERAGEYELSYLHLSSVGVRSGDRVEAGERLGAVGVSGTRSIEEPHLHFGVREAADRHAYLDPLSFLASPPASDPKPELPPVPVADPAPAPGPVVLPPASGSAPADEPSTVPTPSRLPVFHSLRVAHALGTPRAESDAAPRGVAAPHATVRTAEHQESSEQSRSPVSPAHGPAARLATSHSTPVTPVSHEARRAHHGLDLGWLAACLGLVLAATLLARLPGHGRASSLRSRCRTTSRRPSTT